MKRAAILIACLCAAAAIAAPPDWESRCAAEGGCLLVTRQAFDTLVAELARLRLMLEAAKREQCA